MKFNSLERLQSVLCKCAHDYRVESERQIELDFNQSANTKAINEAKKCNGALEKMGKF